MPFHALDARPPARGLDKISSAHRLEFSDHLPASGDQHVIYGKLLHFTNILSASIICQGIGYGHLSPSFLRSHVNTYAAMGFVKLNLNSRS